MFLRKNDILVSLMDKPHEFGNQTVSGRLNYAGGAAANQQGQLKNEVGHLADAESHSQAVPAEGGWSDLYGTISLDEYSSPYDTSIFSETSPESVVNAPAVSLTEAKEYYRGPSSCPAPGSGGHVGLARKADDLPVPRVGSPTGGHTPILPRASTPTHHSVPTPRGKRTPPKLAAGPIRHNWSIRPSNFINMSNESFNSNRLALSGSKSNPNFYGSHVVAPATGFAPQTSRMPINLTTHPPHHGALTADTPQDPLALTQSERQMAGQRPIILGQSFAAESNRGDVVHMGKGTQGSPPKEGHTRQSSGSHHPLANHNLNINMNNMGPNTNVSLTAGLGQSVRGMAPSAHTPSHSQSRTTPGAPSALGPQAGFRPHPRPVSISPATPVPGQNPFVSLCYMVNVSLPAIGVHIPADRVAALLKRTHEAFSKTSFVWVRLQQPKRKSFPLP